MQILEQDHSFVAVMVAVIAYHWFSAAWLVVVPSPVTVVACAPAAVARTGGIAPACCTAKLAFGWFADQILVFVS